MKYILNKLKFLIFRYRWRKENKDNSTFPTKFFDANKVKVGYGSYGPLSVSTWGSNNEKLDIGMYCSIASNVHFILGGNHKYDNITTFPFLVKYGLASNEAYSNGPIIVEDDVWIGTNAIILSGITIKRGAIIAAGSIVTKDVPPYTIVAGNPAKVIKTRFSKEICDYLYEYLELKQYDSNSFKKYKEQFYEQLTDDNYKRIVNIINEIE